MPCVGHGERDKYADRINVVFIFPSLIARKTLRRCLHYYLFPSSAAFRSDRQYIPCLKSPDYLFTCRLNVEASCCTLCPDGNSTPPQGEHLFLSNVPADWTEWFHWPMGCALLQAKRCFRGGGTPTNVLCRRPPSLSLTTTTGQPNITHTHGMWIVLFRPGCTFTPFRAAAVPFLGTNYLKIEWFVPQKGTAVLKGFNSADFAPGCVCDRFSGARCFPRQIERDFFLFLFFEKTCFFFFFRPVSNKNVIPAKQ